VVFYHLSIFACLLKIRSILNFFTEYEFEIPNTVFVDIWNPVKLLCGGEGGGRVVFGETDIFSHAYIHTHTHTHTFMSLNLLPIGIYSKTTCIVQYYSITDNIITCMGHTV
jgi:hypothetical protein